MNSARLTGFALAAAALMASCSQTGGGDGYRITGTAPSIADGDTVYLCEMRGVGSLIPQDTAFVKGGEFVFKGVAEGARVRFIIPYHNGRGVGAAQIILENADISVDVSVDPEESTVSGGHANTLWNKLRKESARLSTMQQAQMEQAQGKELTDKEKEDILAELDTLNNMFLALHYNYIADNLPSDFSDMLLGYTFDMLDPGHQASLLKLFGEKQPQSANYKSILAKVKAAEPTSVGRQFTDFTLTTPEGKEVSLSEVVAANKLTLVDFWASWCGPCRREMPNIVKAYETYHAKGFEVLGVSLDADKDAWTKAIKAMGLKWPHVSDLSEWDCGPAQTYNVRAIPANVLISKDGTIISRDLFGDELAEVVGSILAQQE